MRVKIVGRGGLVILFLASSACAAAPSSNQPPSAGDVALSEEDVAPPEGEVVPLERVVGPLEGDVVSSDGSATLQIPDGALPEGMDLDGLSVVPLETEASSAGSPGGEVLASYALEPSGLTFLKPVTLSITFPMPAATHAFTISLTSEDGETEFLEPSELSVDETGTSLTTVVSIRHFSRVEIDQRSFWEIRTEVPDQIFRGQPFDLNLTITRTKDLLVGIHYPVRSFRFLGENWDLQGKLSAKQPPGWGVGATPEEVGTPNELTTVNGNSISFTREFTCESDRAYIRYSAETYFKTETWLEDYEDLKKTYDRYSMHLSSVILIWCDRLPEPTPSGEQTIGADLEILDDPGGHAPFVRMPMTIFVGATFGALTLDPDDFSITGPDPWVDVHGVQLPGGNIQADGTGTVAGFPDIRARFEGTLVDGSLEGVYSLGDDGGLPGGAAITFTVQGAAIAAPPPEIVDETPQAFFDLYSQAMQAENTGFLLDRLHPVVIDMYGAPACQTRVEGLLQPTLQAQVNSVEGPMPWLFERDGQVHEIRQTHNVDVTITVGGEPSDRQTHLEQIDGLQTWFTDCGDPLQ